MCEKARARQEQTLLQTTEMTCWCGHVAGCWAPIGATQGTNHNLTPQNVNLIIFPWERAGLPVRTRGSLSAAHE